MKNEKNTLIVSDNGTAFDFKSIDKVLCNVKSTMIQQKRHRDGNVLSKIKRFEVDYVAVLKGGFVCHINNFLVQRNQIVCKQRKFYLSAHYSTWQNFKNGKFPKDLFHPIKVGINRFFTSNDYFIDGNFELSSIDTEFNIILAKNNEHLRITMGAKKQQQKTKS